MPVKIETLNDLGRAAKENVSAQKAADGNEVRGKNILTLNEIHPDKYDKTEGEDLVAKGSEGHTSADEEGARLYRDHNAEMHDLARIEAHLAGVAITVEQPTEIGVQIPVQVDHK